MGIELIALRNRTSICALAVVILGLLAAGLAALWWPWASLAPVDRVAVVVDGGVPPSETRRGTRTKALRTLGSEGAAAPAVVGSDAVVTLVVADWSAAGRSAVREYSFVPFDPATFFPGPDEVPFPDSGVSELVEDLLEGRPVADLAAVAEADRMTHDSVSGDDGPWALLLAVEVERQLALVQKERASEVFNAVFRDRFGASPFGTDPPYIIRNREAGAWYFANAPQARLDDADALAGILVDEFPDHVAAQYGHLYRLAFSSRYDPDVAAEDAVELLRSGPLDPLVEDSAINRLTELRGATLDPDLVAWLLEYAALDGDDGARVAGFLAVYGLDHGDLDLAESMWQRLSGDFCSVKLASRAATCRRAQDVEADLIVAGRLRPRSWQMSLRTAALTCAMGGWTPPHYEAKGLWNRGWVWSSTADQDLSCVAEEALTPAAPAGQQVRLLVRRTE